MKQPSAQQGLSLVELMVAITLGLVLLAGVATVFVGSRQAYRIQESTGLLQDNGRFALETLGRAIRDAGFYHGAAPGAMQWFPSALDDTDAAACTADAWRANTRRPIELYEGGASSPLAGCTVAAYLPQSDVLVVRHADANSATGTGYLPRAEVAEQPASALLLRVIPGLRGAVYTVAEADTVDSAFTDDDEDEAVFDYRLRARVFHAGTPADAGDTGAALYEWSADFGAQPQQPIISGVERLRFVAGLDDDADRAVDRWLRPSQITAADFDRIIAVRVGLVVRGEALDDFVDDRSYRLPGGYEYTPAEADRRFPRRLYLQDFQVRNRIRG